MRHSGSERQDVNAGVATRITADREQGVGHITQPYRYNGTPEHGTSILLLWGEAVPCDCTSPCLMTSIHAQSLKAHVRPIARVACPATSQQEGCQ